MMTDQNQTTEPQTQEDIIPASEAFAYRRRALAAEKELVELRAKFDECQNTATSSEPCGYVPPTSGSTRSLKDKTVPSGRRLHKAAAEAARNHDRKSLMEYMKARRNLK